MRAFRDKALIHCMPGHVPAHQESSKEKHSDKDGHFGIHLYCQCDFTLGFITPASGTASDRLNTHGFLGPSVAVQCKGVIVWSVDQGSYKSLLVLGLWVVGGQVVFVREVKNLGKNMFG